jgi:hypothetical protein
MKSCPGRDADEGEAFAPVPNRSMITISIMLANIMQGVDNTILNVALPHVQGSLSASLDQIAWALTSYIVCAAIMMPLTGWLAGRFGIKYVFLASVIGVHDRLGAVRRCREPRRARFLSRRAGGGWRRAGSSISGHLAADQSAGASWACHGGVRHRYDPWGDHGTGARGLVDL